MPPEPSPIRCVTVELGERSYPVMIGSGILPSFGTHVRERVSSTEAVVVSDSSVAALYLPKLRRILTQSGIRSLPIVIPPGERQKNIRRANSIISVMMEKRISRSAFIIALGGGVVGDLAGFVAAVYQRGIDIIQVPTTLLAQVDSSVGGKVGVNHPAGKNMIGAFHQPRLVFSDSGVLATLPARELVCGLGEVIKYGIISDRSLFDDLETRLDDILALEPDAVAAAVARCCTIKAAVVKGDEREQAPAEGRAILNFGHTVGHSIESAMHYRNIKHGEAVLLGMLIEARIACRMGLLAAPEEGRIGSLIRRLQLPRVLPGLGSGELFALMAHDKKVRENKIRFILPTAVGSVRMVDDVPRHIVTQSIDELKKTFRPGNRS